jgi:hypothetical protein
LKIKSKKLRLAERIWGRKEGREKQGYRDQMGKRRAEG